MLRTGTHPRTGSRQEPRIEEDRLGLGHLARRPAHAVLAVQLRGECPASERAVELLLGEPDRELPISIEAQPQPGVAQDVVDGADGARFLRWLVNAIHEPTMLEPGATP